MKKLYLLALATVAVLAQAQTFPGTKPITFVVPFAAGGPTDRVARDLAEAMRKSMGGSANFVVENVNGAGGTIGMAKVAKANPDGHILLLHHIGMASAPGLYRKLSFKVADDFEYLGMINEVPMTLIGKPQLPANTYRDFENYIKANAGKLNIAHAGLGSASHLCGLMWQSRLQASEAMTTIPFSGTAPAMNALVGGQVDIMCDQTTNTTAQIETKKVKGFAVTTTKRLTTPALKDLPTLQESGIKDFQVSIWHGLYAPKGTPAAEQARLNAALKVALKDPDFIKKQEGLGAVIFTDNRVEPAEHKKFVANEIQKWAPIIKKAGVYVD
jgi:tripartite-type tricarboxylate transporter receptor subunit TctC